MTQATTQEMTPAMTKTTQRTGSVRARILAWMVLIISFITAGLIFSVREVLLNEVALNANASTANEIEEFRNFAELGVDPTTAQPFTSVDSMLTAYISRQHTGYREQLIGASPSRIIFHDEQDDYAESAGYRLHQDRALLEALRTNPASAGLEQTPAGPVHWGKIDVTLKTDGGEETGALIVLEYIQPELDSVRHAVTTMIWVGLAGLVISTGIIWFVAGRITKPIRNLRAVAETINDKDFSGRVQVRGDDDVAAMTETFNRMLDRLEEATITERQFMDDVSHELRTPITIVRGHLELMDRNEEQAQTLALVDNELDRMGRIVADLLTLAKSERPDFVQPHPVDVADLMISLDSKVQAFTRHRWTISTIAEGTATIDEQRITQALVQLAANAAQYSPEGTTITLGSEFTGTGSNRHLKLWVRDRGPGVAPEDAPHLFDRFKRNHAKNPATANKHSVGAGLGLAIVQSIAEAHHGTVWITQPDDGTGAIFGIALPAPDTAPIHATTAERN